MRWLLLIMVFDISNGGMRVVDQTTRAFQSEAACNAEGQRLTAAVRYPSPNLRSMSMCIPESAFED